MDQCRRDSVINHVPDTSVVPDFRRSAIAAAAGTSGPPIYELVRRMLDSAGVGGAVIDFGAGTGSLTRALAASGRFTSVTGLDALPRPASLDSSVAWLECDLNNDVSLPRSFDVVVCAEVIEHLENPRATFRSFAKVLLPGGTLVLTMPNQESLRAYAALLFGGHFASFRGNSYPAHITALLRLDLERICAETGFEAPAFSWSNIGGLPARPRVTWQQLTASLARGRLFSDNIGMITCRE